MLKDQGDRPKPQQFIATDRGDIVVYDYEENKILKSASLVGDINASGGVNKLKGTLA